MLVDTLRLYEAEKTVVQKTAQDPQAAKNASGDLLNNVLDVEFTQEELKQSCGLGLRKVKKPKTAEQIERAKRKPLHHTKVDTIKGK